MNTCKCGHSLQDHAISLSGKAGCCQKSISKGWEYCDCERYSESTITSTKIASWKGILKSMRDIMLMAHDKDTAAAIDNAIDVMTENYKHLEFDEMAEDWEDTKKDLIAGTRPY